MDSLGLLWITIGVDRDGEHLCRGHLDEPLAHVTWDADQLGHEGGRDASDRGHEVDLRTELDLSDEFVREFGYSCLQAPHQARPEGLHEDAAYLPMTRRVRNHQAFEVGVSHRELAVCDRPSSLGWAEVPLLDLPMCPFGKLVEDRRRIAGVPDREPERPREQFGMAPDETLVLPLRENPQSSRIARWLIPRDPRGAALSGDGGVHVRWLLYVEGRVLPRRPFHRSGICRRHRLQLDDQGF